jgi:hypothetical protein
MAVGRKTSVIVAADVGGMRGARWPTGGWPCEESPGEAAASVCAVVQTVETLYGDSARRVVKMSHCISSCVDMRSGSSVRLQGAHCTPTRGVTTRLCPRTRMQRRWRCWRPRPSGGASGGIGRWVGTRSNRHRRMRPAACQKRTTRKLEFPYSPRANCSCRTTRRCSTARSPIARRNA